MMRCPFTSKCHNALARELEEARAAHRETIRVDGEVIGALKTENSILRFRLSMEPGIDLTDLSSAARRRLSGYTTAVRRPKNPCGKCDSMVKQINRYDKLKSQCSKFEHPVNASDGTCPNHSHLEQIENVA